MRRRAFICACGAWALLGATRALAQSKPPRVTLLLLSRPENSGPLLGAFTARLKELGYIEGRDISIEARWFEGKLERLPAIAQEIVASRPAVIVSIATPATLALRNATRAIPMVFIAVAAPDEQGFVASLARPGGNMTGTSFRGGAMDTKLLEAVRATLPAARRVALLDPAGDPIAIKFGSSTQKRFESMSFETEFIPVKDAEELERAIDEVARRKFDLLYARPLTLLALNAQKIAELALARRLPFVGPRRFFAEAGGLMSYSNDLRADFRAAAGFVHRILKGAKPGDLPVEQPDRFELVLNLRTAKALGIKFPQSVLLQATEVIE
jgi:putative ABC transport system substrate-binding protein